MHHRVWCCPATEDLRLGHRNLVQAARDAGPNSAAFNLGGLLVTPADDKPTATDVRLSQGDQQIPVFRAGKGTIYIDSSASTEGIPELRRAGWAAVQIDDATGEEVASISGVVPAGWPQTAQAAEHCALGETAASAEPQVVVVGDCAGVVSESRRLADRDDTSAWEKMMYGGMWRRARRSRALPALTAMQKVKAHQAWQTLHDPLEKARARGNERADALAKQAALGHTQWAKYQRQEVEDQWNQAVAVAELTGKAIARWPRAVRSERAGLGRG